MSVAGALVTPAQTAKILSGLAGGVGAIRGYYDSEIVIAKTIQIAQAHMRDLRTIVGNNIRSAMTHTVAAYPLSLAMSDLEEYYRAGTLTAGLIKALGEAGTSATEGAAQKQSIIEIGFVSNSSTQALQACLRRPGARESLLGLMPSRSRAALAALTADPSPGAEERRIALLEKARAAGIC